MAMHVPIPADGLIVVHIRVFGGSGTRVLEAALDTGACLVTIHPQVAAVLGYSLADAPKIGVATANGIVEAPQITLARVDLGPYAETDVPALCLALPGGSVSALVGLSLLSRFRVDLDFPNSRATILKP